MMGIQIIKTESGEDLVVLPRSEYDALIAAYEEALEDAADVAAFDEAMANFDPADVLPAEVSHYITSGDSRVRAFRKWRGMSEDELAEKAGLSTEALLSLEDRSTMLTDTTAAKLRLALQLRDTWLDP
jgi:ribosome-binding protein aMBF1 (putative translation factor)